MLILPVASRRLLSAAARRCSASSSWAEEAATVQTGQGFPGVELIQVLHQAHDLVKKSTLDADNGGVNGADLDEFGKLGALSGVNGNAAASTAKGIVAKRASEPEQANFPELYERQLELEQRSLYDALEKYKSEVNSAKTRDMVAALPRARRLLMKWFEPLVVEIRAEQQRVGDGWTFDLDWALVSSTPPGGQGGGLKVSEDSNVGVQEVSMLDVEEEIDLNYWIEEWGLSGQTASL